MSSEQGVRHSKPRVGGPAKGAGHGGGARGYTKTHPPFEPGNEVAVTHGAYSSVLKLRDRANEIASQLVELAGDDFDAKYRPALEAASIAATRLERACEALDATHEPESMLKLSADARGWFRELVRVLEACGLTPQASTSSGVPVALTTLTIVQDAEAQARLFAKLAGLGLLHSPGETVEGDALELREEASS